MNIKHFITSIDISSGGTSTCIKNIIEGISLHSHVELFTFKSSNPVNIEGSQVNVISIPQKIVSTRVLHNQKSAYYPDYPDIVHIHGLWEFATNFVVNQCIRYNIPYVISPHGMLDPAGLKYASWKKKLALHFYQKKHLEKAAALVATSERELRNIRDAGFQNPVALVPHGVTMANVEPKTDMQENAVLFLGRLHPVKGLENLLRAWKQVLQVHPSWKLIIGGMDENGYKKKLFQLARDLRINDSIAFVGEVEIDERDSFYARGKFFVLPSATENFGMVVAEALSAGLPVIVSKGTPWGIVEQHQCGWWVENSPSELANTIMKAIELPENERYTMGLRGKRLVEKNFTVESIGNKLMHLYWWVIKAEKLPGFISM